MYISVIKRLMWWCARNILALTMMTYVLYLCIQVSFHKLSLKINTSLTDDVLFKLSSQLFLSRGTVNLLKRLGFQEINLRCSTGLHCTTNWKIVIESFVYMSFSETVNLFNRSISFLIFLDSVNISFMKVVLYSFGRLETKCWIFLLIFWFVPVLMKVIKEFRDVVKFSNPPYNFFTSPKYICIFQYSIKNLETCTWKVNSYLECMSSICVKMDVHIFLMLL